MKSSLELHRLRPLTGEVNHWLSRYHGSCQCAWCIRHERQNIFVLKVDELEGGKTGKRKDLSSFDKGHIVMASLQGQSISKPQLLWRVPGLHSIKSGPRKKKRRTGDRVVGGRGSQWWESFWCKWTTVPDECLSDQWQRGLMIQVCANTALQQCMSVIQ